MNREATLSRRVLADKRKAENAKSYQMIFPDDSDMMVAYIKFKVFDDVDEGQEHVMEFKFKYGCLCYIIVALWCFYLLNISYN